MLTSVPVPPAASPASARRRAPARSSRSAPERARERPRRRARAVRAPRRRRRARRARPRRRPSRGSRPRRSGGMFEGFAGSMALLAVTLVVLLAAARPPERRDGRARPAAAAARGRARGPRARARDGRVRRAALQLLLPPAVLHALDRDRPRHRGVPRLRGRRDDRRGRRRAAAARRAPRPTGASARSRCCTTWRSTCSRATAREDVLRAHLQRIADALGRRAPRRRSTARARSWPATPRRRCSRVELPSARYHAAELRRARARRDRRRPAPHAARRRS